MSFGEGDQSRTAIFGERNQIYVLKYIIFSCSQKCVIATGLFHKNTTGRFCKNEWSRLVVIREKWLIGTGSDGIYGGDERKIAERDQSQTLIFAKATSQDPAFLWTGLVAISGFDLKS